MFPLKHGEALAADIPGARLLTLEGAGHGVYRDDWEMIVATILEHTAAAEGTRRWMPASHQARVGGPRDNLHKSSALKAMQAGHRSRAGSPKGRRAGVSRGAAVTLKIAQTSSQALGT
jgi:hypothetical protein